jgi:uridine kinase
VLRKKTEIDKLLRSRLLRLGQVPSKIIHIKYQTALTKLKNDESTKLPITTYIKNSDDKLTLHTVEQEINPKHTSIIFVEGIFLYKYEKLRDLLDFKIFVEVDEDIRLSRMGKKYLVNNSF